jgi:hypothetical protein
LSTYLSGMATFKEADFSEENAMDLAAFFKTMD